MKRLNKKGFSLAEVLVSLLLVSTILAATMPIITKKTSTGTPTTPWQYTDSGQDIYYGTKSTTQHVGIGTDDADYALTIGDINDPGTDGSIIAIGKFDNTAASTATTTAPPSSNTHPIFMWLPYKAALRAGQPGIGWDDGNIGDYSVAFGDSNIAMGKASFIGGGSNNEANKEEATIAGGQNNLASGQSSFIGGGGGNTASGEYSVIAGGGDRDDNTHNGGGYGNQATKTYAFIGGGHKNKASGEFAIVSGGRINTSSDYCSTVSGGFMNEASKQYAAVAGGSANNAHGQYSFIGSGANNETEGNFSVVVGGGSATISTGLNYAEGDYSSILGGSGNKTVGEYSTISGGSYNQATGDHSTVSGGSYNQATGDHSTVSGGFTNVASKQYAAVLGGHYNQAKGGYSSILGGSKNTINPGSEYCFVAGQNMYVTGNNIYAFGQASSTHNFLTSDTFNIYGNGDNTNQVLQVTGGGNFTGNLTTDTLTVSGVTTFAEDVTFKNSATFDRGVDFNSDVTIRGRTVIESSAGFWTTSDRRLKDIIGSYNKGLDEILRLKTYKFTYKNDKEKQLNTGIMAQDVQPIFPEAVKEHKKHLVVNKDPIFYAMVNSIQELKAENDALKSRLSGIEKRLAAIENTSSTHAVKQDQKPNIFIQFWNWLNSLFKTSK